MSESSNWWQSQWKFAIEGWEASIADRERLRKQVDALCAECAALRIERDAMRAVVDAASAHVEHLRLSDATDLRAAIAKFDALPKERGG